MEIVAEGLDLIVDALAAGTASGSSNGWGSWVGGGVATVDPQPPAEFYAVTRDPEDADPRYGILENSGIVIGDTDLVKTDATGDIIDLPPASPERKALRRRLAEQIDLPGFFPPIHRSTPEAVEGIMRSYELGGPYWLYANRIVDGDHDVFKALPPAAKQLMVVDMAEDSARLAWEFQRDVMKDEDVEGSGIAIAADNRDGVLSGAQVPLS